MSYCINCKYYMAEHKLCTHPKAINRWYPHMDWIYYSSANDMRRNSKLCGRNGALYIDKDDYMKQKDEIMQFPSCKGCKYVNLNTAWTSQDNQLYYAHCSHPNAILSTDMVTGEVKYKTAQKMREDKINDIKNCGTMGLLFEPQSHEVKQDDSTTPNVRDIKNMVLFLCACVTFWLLVFSNFFLLAYIMVLVYFWLHRRTH